MTPTKIEKEFSKSESEHMKELIENLRFFRRKYKNSLFTYQEKLMRETEVMLNKIYKNYLID